MKKLLYTTLVVLFVFFPLVFVEASVPIKILLVPGHDNEVWGAQYGNTKEADMNLNLATKIFNLLEKDKRFEVHITRKNDGYTTEFAEYLSNKEAITKFKEDAKVTRQKSITEGTFVKKPNPPHNPASEETSIKLYGINKWANENKMDAVIHVHFNDYPRPDIWTIGKYKGFAIYIPDDQMINAVESISLGENIFTELKKKYVTSTFEKELGGLVPDQSLIALGANGTLIESVRSILIEYGYIYRFKTKKVREASYINMANLTAVGIKNYFFKK